MKSAAQDTALAFIDAHGHDLSAWTKHIFDLGETAWREYESAAWYVALLRKEGFTVEEGSGGMPTAFAAHWTNGAGPSIGLYAEYDAVPGNCQDAATVKRPRPGLSEHAGGHTDPHSGLGIASLGALLGVKAAMARHGVKGTLRFTGEPAEKVRGSKPIHAAKGYYDGLDGIISFHPFYMFPLCNTARWDTHCGAAYAMIYRFICDAPENWLSPDEGAPIAQNHAAVRAPGANDALMLMYMSSKALRESMLTHQGGWSISEAILTAGQATADNLPAGLADLQYIVRVPTLDMAERVTAMLDRNAAHAAAMTGCRHERHWVCKSRPGLANHAMARLTYESLTTVGAPRWDEAARAVGREIQKTLGLAPMERPFLDLCEQLLPPEEAERLLRQDLPPSQTHATSDDYTDMCWHAPTARFYIARAALKAPMGAKAPDSEEGRPTPPGFRYPAWVANALGGIPATIDPMVTTAAKTVALTALRLLEDKHARDAAKEEFVARTGGGVGGDRWIAPLADYEAPIHFRWPEYVTTKRGREWWIPTGPQ